MRPGLAQVEIAKVGLAGAGRVSETSVGGRLSFRRHIAGAGVSPRCAAVVLPCFKVRDVPYHIVVARLTSYGMCHWATRVRRTKSFGNAVPRELRATGRHVVRDLGLGGAHAGSFPGVFACTGGSEIRAPAVPSTAGFEENAKTLYQVLVPYE